MTNETPNWDNSSLRQRLGIVLAGTFLLVVLGVLLVGLAVLLLFNAPGLLLGLVFLLLLAGLAGLSKLVTPSAPIPQAVTFTLSRTNELGQEQTETHTVPAGTEITIPADVHLAIDKVA